MKLQDIYEAYFEAWSMTFPDPYNLVPVGQGMFASISHDSMHVEIWDNDDIDFYWDMFEEAMWTLHE